MFLERVKAAIDTVLVLFLRVALVVLLLSLAYLLYGLLSGAIPRLDVPGAFTDQDRLRILRNVQTFGALCFFSLAVLTFCTVVLRPDDQDVLFLLGIGTAVVWLGFPALIGYLLRSYLAAHNEATRYLLAMFVNGGRVMALLLCIPVVRGIGRWLRQHPWLRALPEPKAATRIPSAQLPPGREPTIFSPCWHLPYCREFLLRVCPAYQARKKCWKLGRGCYCDQSMIDLLVKGVKTARGRSAQAYLRQEISDRLQVAKSRTQKAPCGRCFIYLEHQRLKHKFISPWLYPLTALLMWALYPYAAKGYYLVAEGGRKAWAYLSFTSSVQQAVQAAEQSTSSLLGRDYAPLVFTVILGFFVLILLLRLTETVIFKWKW